MAGELNVGTLTGTVEIEDHASSNLDRMANRVDILGQQLGTTTDQVLKQAAAFFTAQGAYDAVKEVVSKLTSEVEQLSYEGAKIADVEENFDRLTAASGRLGDTLVKDLQTGTHGTIANFDLMRTANQDLAAGMNLTNAQFLTLSKGAFALAQATGVDVAQAMGTMNDAMLTGRVRALAMLTGKIDLAAAEEKFAKSLGTTAEHLSAEGKIEASREAILNAVSGATARLGEQTDGLDEKVDQARTTWHNFENDLGKTIATNPTLLRSFDEVGAAIKNAFGGDRDVAIKTIAADVGEAAHVAAEFAKVGIDVLSFLYSMRDVIIPIGVGLTTYVIAVEGAKVGTYALGLAMNVTANTAATLGTKLGAVGLAATAISVAFELGHWQPISDFFEKMGLRMQGFSASEADAMVKGEHLREQQEKAAEAAAKNAAATDDLAGASDSAGKSAEELAKFTQESKTEMSAAAEAAKKLAEIDKEIAAVGKDYTVTLKEMDPELVKNIEHLDKNGISMGDLKIKYKLTDAEVNALTKDMEAQQKAMDAATKQAQEHADAMDRLNKLGHDQEETLDRIPSKLRQQAEEWLHLGASIDDVAKATGLTKEQVDAIKKSMDDSTSSTEKWGMALSDVRDELGKTTSQLIAEADAADKANAANRDMGGSTEVNRGNLGQEAAYWNIDSAAAYAAAAKGFSFAEIVQAWQSGTLGSWVPHGPKIAGFKDGGYGDFGDGTLAMLHGKEVITPIDKMPIGGSVTINNYINGTAADVARQVTESLQRTLNQRKLFPSL